MGKMALRTGKVTSGIEKIFLTLAIAAITMLCFMSYANAETANTLAQGTAYLDAGDYNKAKSIFLDVIANDPNSNNKLTAQASLLKLYIFTNNDTEATTALAELKTSYSDKAELAGNLYSVALSCEQTGRTGWSKSLYSEIVARCPNSGEYYNQAALGNPRIDILAMIYSWDYDAADVAINNLAETSHENPFLPELLDYLAFTYKSNGQPYQYRVSYIYQLILNKCPGSSYTKAANLGLLQIDIRRDIDSGDDANALAGVDNVISNYNDIPGVGDAVCDMVGQFTYLRKSDCANQVIAKLAEKMPSEVNKAKYVRADNVIKLIVRSGNEDLIMGELEKQCSEIKDEAYCAKLINDTAFRRFQMNNGLEAKQIYQYLLQRYPNSAEARYANYWSDRIDIYKSIRTGRIAEARAKIDNCLTNPCKAQDADRAIFEIGMVCLFADQYQDADVLFNRVITQYPQSLLVEHCQYYLAGNSIASLIDANNFAQADTELSSLMSATSDSPILIIAIFHAAEKYYEKAMVLKEQGNNQLAQSHLQKALEIMDRLMGRSIPFDVKIYTLKGQCYSLLGQPQQALACYEKVASDYPDFELAWYNLSLIGRQYEEMVEAGDIDKSAGKERIHSAYEKIMKDYPESRAANYAKYWLKRN